MANDSMVYRCTFDGSSEIGVYACLTSTYCLVAADPPSDFLDALRTGLGAAFPIVPCTIAGSRHIGEMAVGNKHGLLVPENASNEEIQHLQTCLPNLFITKVALATPGLHYRCNGTFLFLSDCGMAVRQNSPKWFFSVAEVVLRMDWYSCIHFGRE